MSKIRKKGVKCCVAPPDPSAKCKTAPMYNGGQNYRKPKKSPKKVKYSICVDWFEVTLDVSIASHSSLLLFSVDPPETLEVGDFQFEKQSHGTKFYKHIYKVYHHAEPFGSICVNPRSNDILDATWCQFKMDNHKLYQSDWIDGFDNFISELDAVPRSFTRIDIALDGRGHLDIYRGWNNGEYVRLGRAKIIEYKEKVKDDDNVITGVDWGSRGGDKYMTMYSKGRLLERENKGYVVDFWNKSGLISSPEEVKDIQRMELKLRAKSIKKIKDFDYRYLCAPEFLASCMRTHFKKWFEFVENGSGNISRRKRLEFIDWDSVGAKLMEVDSTRPSSETWSAKISIKRIYISSVEGLIDRENADKVMAGLISWYDLHSWYERSHHKWVKTKRHRV